MATTSRRLGALVFPGFELLDVFGPLEMFGYVPGLEIRMIGPRTGTIASTQGPRVWADETLQQSATLDILLIPGGRGTRKLVEDREFIEALTALARRSELVLSVCTGSGLLARTGLLDGRRATSNKAALDWAATQGEKVAWQRSARWVRDGSIVTSSGVAAGIDMALAVIADLMGREFARILADRTEYQWNEDPERDPFARPDITPSKSG